VNLSLLRGVALGAVVAVLAISPPASAAHRKTRPTAHTLAPFKLQAFLLTSSPDSFTDLQAHVGAIEALYPTYFSCQVGSGQVTGQDVPAVTSYAAAHALPLMPRFNCQDGATVHTILDVPALRAQVLAGLLALAGNPSYAGLSLDFENDGAADRATFSAFVTQLAGGLHAMHRRLTVVVDGVTHEDARASTGFYDDRALAAAADRVFVLAWGQHWEGSVPGPIAPLPWVRQVVAYLTSLPNAARFVLGVPMYGLDWPTAPPVGTPSEGSTEGSSGNSPSGGSSGNSPSSGSSGESSVGQGGPGTRGTARQFSNIATLAHSVGAKPLRDSSADEVTFAYTHEGVPHRVWYLDARAILDRLKLARAHSLAVGVWRLGAEDQSLWSSTSLRK
jgi:spore germination protein